MWSINFRLDTILAPRLSGWQAKDKNAGSLIFCQGDLGFLSRWSLLFVKSSLFLSSGSLFVVKSSSSLLSGSSIFKKLFVFCHYVK